MNWPSRRYDLNFISESSLLWIELGTHDTIVHEIAYEIVRN